MPIPNFFAHINYYEISTIYPTKVLIKYQYVRYGHSINKTKRSSHIYLLGVVFNLSKQTQYLSLTNQLPSNQIKNLIQPIQMSGKETLSITCRQNSILLW